MASRALSLATKSPASRRRNTSSKSKSSTSALTKAQNQIARMQNKAKMADMKAAAVIGGVSETALTAAGAGMAAFVNIKAPANLQKVAGIDSRLLLGGALTAYGIIAGSASKKDNMAHTGARCLGTGMLSAVAYEVAHNMAVGEGVSGSAKAARFSGVHMGGVHMGRDVYVSGLAGR